jgi:NADPH-dependent 2,4-dienoyl-CoA reductase/sulfur reductase-like enzyme
MKHLSADVLIVGAGPAGMAAACRAAQSRQVTILDDNPSPGGQIWRGQNSPGRRWFGRLQGIKADRLYSSRVIGLGHGPGTLLVEQPAGRTIEKSEALVSISHRDLIVATGARELFIPFPGWTLPNVTGPGGLQALVKSGLNIKGKRVVVAGSGPLLLAVAAYLKKKGAQVPCVVEQTSFTALSQFAKGLWHYPGKILEAIQLQSQLLGTRYLMGTWVESAAGHGRVESVSLRSNHGAWKEHCDYLAVAYGLAPNLELPTLLGCDIKHGKVTVNNQHQTTINHVYCVGETTGVGGVDLALVEGQIAGAVLAGDDHILQSLTPQRAHWQRFADSLHQAFTIRPEIRSLAQLETIVCRCEDVTLGRLKGHSNWRAAKLHTRCGMGPCQARICGPAVHHLLGWNVESVRPPIFPITIGALAAVDNTNSNSGDSL